MVKKMQTLYSQSSKSEREINNKKISDEKKAVWSQGLAVNHMGAPQAAPQQYLHSECNEPKSVLVGSFLLWIKEKIPLLRGLSQPPGNYVEKSQ